MNRVLFSRKKDDWGTPDYIYLPLHAEFDFDLDPCSDDENHKCKNYLTIADNGLNYPWSYRFKRAFVNPPYSQLNHWVKKTWEESRLGMTNVMLIPARTDRKVFHKYIYDESTWSFRPGVEVRFIKGRITFVGAESGAPFPSCVVIFRPI